LCANGSGNGSPVRIARLAKYRHAAHRTARIIAPPKRLLPAAKDTSDAFDALVKAVTATLASLGWTEFFGDQLEADEADLVPTRIASVHRDRLAGLSLAGPADLTLPANANTGDYAVGDWVLVEPHTHLLRRRLTRKTVLERRTQGGRVPQLAAANVDTLFIVTSCNADFNIARLERYLALANEAGTTPVILLTKADTAEDAEAYQRQAAALQRGLAVVMLNPRVADAATALAAWCGAG